MLKIPLLICLLVGCSFCALSQDDLRIVQLKTELPFLKDTSKSHRLNSIARYYIERGPVRSDSGLKYAAMAFDYNKANNYAWSLCISANLYAKVLLQLSRVNEGIGYYRYAFHLAQQMRYDTLAAFALRGIGQALWYQGNFQSSIDTIELVTGYFKRFNYTSDVAEAMVTIADVYGDQGNYEKAFEKAREGLRLNDSINYVYNIVLSFAQLGTLYKNTGDYTAALDYYRRGFRLDPSKDSWSYRSLCHRTGDLYCELQQYDSAYHYYQEGFSGDPRNKSARMRLGHLFLAQKNYDSSTYYYTGLYDELKGGGEGNIFYSVMLGLGEIALIKKEIKKATFYAEKVLMLAEQKNSRLLIRDACQLLYQIYDTLHRADRALFIYKKYVAIKDSIITDQFKGKLYTFKHDAQIELLRSENLLAEQRLKGNRMIRNILTISIVALILIGMFIFSNITLKRKNDQLQYARVETEFQRRAADLEMQALRAQMNPHFIFNCLSSINRFILKNEPDKASDYLTSFSRLIRLVLINSQKPLIALEDEVEMLRLYIEMEQLRFKHSFDYSITYINNIEQGNVLIPPLLLQPFCENAIWHGLMHKEGHGYLGIEFTIQNNSLRCTISDNGVGRAKAAEIKNQSSEKLKSLGLQLTAERLALFNEGSSVKTFYEMEDMVDEKGNVAGTKVILYIQHKELTADTAGYKI